MDCGELEPCEDPIVRFEFTAEHPPNFWNTVAPDEYDFFANVDPAVPHPRWSQATERMIGTDETRPTLPYNGYGEQVAHLYSCSSGRISAASTPWW